MHKLIWNYVSMQYCIDIIWSWSLFKTTEMFKENMFLMKNSHWKKNHYTSEHFELFGSFKGATHWAMENRASAWFFGYFWVVGIWASMIFTPHKIDFLFLLPARITIWSRITKIFYFFPALFQIVDNYLELGKHFH